MLRGSHHRYSISLQYNRNVNIYFVTYRFQVVAKKFLVREIPKTKKQKFRDHGVFTYFLLYLQILLCQNRDFSSK